MKISKIKFKYFFFNLTVFFRSNACVTVCSTWFSNFYRLFYCVTFWTFKILSLVNWKNAFKFVPLTLIYHCQPFELRKTGCCVRCQAYCLFQSLDQFNQFVIHASPHPHHDCDKGVSTNNMKTINNDSSLP